ncbi:hypothetical protein MMC26_002762 [Xylographa opegraphella]|nr:hypothetical protein [Xylographa opegraphella]
MANLNDIPPEIRLRIYPYVLLSEQTIVPLAAEKPLEENILRSHYETAIFTVNRKISRESLSYFYSHNSFVAVETNTTGFLSQCCRAIPMNFGHSRTQFKEYVLKLQFYQFLGHTTMRHTRCAFAVFARRYLRNFIRLFEAYHSPIRQLLPEKVTMRMNIVLKTTGDRFRDTPGIKASLVNDLKLLRGFPDAIEDYMSLTIYNLPSHLNDLAVIKNYEEAEQISTAGERYRQLADYDTARGEYLIALFMATVPKHPDLEQGFLDTVDLLYVNLRRKMSVLDSQQKRHKCAIVEASKAFHTPGGRDLWDFLSDEHITPLYARWASALADDGQYEEAISLFEKWPPLVTSHPSYRTLFEELKAGRKSHEAQQNT